MSEIKTEKQVERDFFLMVSADALGSAIRGKVYRGGYRPDNAKTEDIVVKFLAGLDEQIQSGVIILNVYVPNVPYSKTGRMVEDLPRVEYLEGLIQDFVKNNAQTEYLIMTDGSPASSPVEGIEQHCIFARIKFNRLAQ